MKYCDEHNIPMRPLLISEYCPVCEGDESEIEVELEPALEWCDGAFCDKPCCATEPLWGTASWSISFFDSDGLKFHLE